jgi:hypothetical protein
MHQPAATIGRAVVRLLAWSSVALTVSCMAPETPPPAPPPAPPETASVEAPPPVVPPRPARKPAQPAPPALAALPPPAESEPDADAGPGFERLQGLDEAATLALLGEPQERGESPPAILWHYAGQDCGLDVYFYLDLQSQEMRVLHYEVRDQDDGTGRPHQKCYRELVTGRGPEPAGSADSPR